MAGECQGMRVRLTVLALILGAALLGPTPPALQSAAGARVKAKRPVMKSRYNDGIEFAGVYRTVGRGHKLTIEIGLEHQDNLGDPWVRLPGGKLKSRRRASRVAISARGPCLLGADRYRTRGRRIRDHQTR